jgi:hypothetical protein
MFLGILQRRMKVVQYSKKRQGGCMRDEVYRKTKAERERGCKTERRK